MSFCSNVLSRSCHGRLNRKKKTQVQKHQHKVKKKRKNKDREGKREAKLDKLAGIGEEEK